MTHKTPTLIIGAGPAGLAVAGRLTQLGLPFTIIDKAEQIAHSWREHYERLCLHTVKEHSNLPHQEIPDDFPVYVPRLDMIAYWENYVAEMGIKPLLGQEVVRVKRVDDVWITQTNQVTFESERVVVATGYNRVPVVPTWAGQEKFKGQMIHSRAYQNGEPFKGKKVLVVGIGNTGAELALDLHEHGAMPSISVRSPVNFILRDVGGRPAQRTAIMLGKLPGWLYDFIARQVQKLTIGDLSPYGLKLPHFAPSAGLRKYGKVPVIDIGTLALIKARKVIIKPDIQRFNEDSVTFSDGTTEPFDAVLTCTGYRAKVEEFLENGEEILNERGYPKDLWFNEKHLEGLYFCGFSIPLSGILRNIKIDSEKIVGHIKVKV